MRLSVAVGLLVFGCALSARASFHLIQIEQVIGGVNGDTTAQAVQLRMRQSGENLIASAQLVVVDEDGNNPITLITFPSNVSSGAGKRILITTSNFASHESTPIASDFTMTAIPASYLAAGRLLYRRGGDIYGNGGVTYWSLSWGGYTGPNTGSNDNDSNGNFGPPFSGVLPSDSTVALRFTGGASAMSTTNAADYALTTGSAIFTNNAGASTSLIAPAAGGSLGNISTRLQVGTADNVLIAGFIISGSAPKRVLVRARGPSLSAAGIGNPLINPELSLHDAANTIATNRNWETTEVGGVITADQVEEIRNSGVKPDASAEPAMIVTLAPGSYTAIVQGENSGTGIGTVEVYELGANTTARLANISTRGFVQTGDNVMIGGFINLEQPTRLFIRARGPSLASVGIANPLPNPQLSLHDASNTIATNSDWETTQVGGVITSDQRIEIQNSVLKPAASAEAAMIVTLAPGNYTVIVSDANSATGVGTVEVYTLQ